MRMELGIALGIVLTALGLAVGVNGVTDLLAARVSNVAVHGCLLASESLRVDLRDVAAINFEIDAVLLRGGNWVTGVEVEPADVLKVEIAWRRCVGLGA